MEMITHTHKYLKIILLEDFGGFSGYMTTQDYSYIGSKKWQSPQRKLIFLVFSSHTHTIIIKTPRFPMEITHTNNITHTKITKNENKTAHTQNKITKNENKTAHTHNIILAIGSNLLPVVRAEGSSFLSSFCHNHSQQTKSNARENVIGSNIGKVRNSLNGDKARNKTADAIILTEQKTEPSLLRLRSVKAEGFSINTTSIDGFPSATIFASVLSGRET